MTKTNTANDNRRARAAAIAARCANAYSADRYGSWREVASKVRAMGFTDAETEAVMRSKITRWAADASGKPYGKVPASVVSEYIRNDEARRGYRVREEIREWASEYAEVAP